MGDPRAIALAASQNGIVATWQLRDLGLSRQQLYRMRRSDDWELVAPDVHRHAAAPDGPARCVTEAVLGAGRGAYLSHESAAAWWGHPGCRLADPVQVTTPSRAKPRAPGATTFHVHRPDQRWITRHGGVPVARPELVAMELFAIRGYQRASRIVDRLWSMRLLSGRSIALLLRDMGRRGRNGTAGLRKFLDARGLEYRPPDSSLESRVEQILDRSGISVRRQVDLGGEENWTGRVDFLHETLPLVIEVQSERFHTSLTDREADARRIERLRGDGFRVVEVTDTQVFADPGSVVTAVRREIDAPADGRGGQDAA